MIRFLGDILENPKEGLRGCLYMKSDGRGEGGSDKSDFISKGALINHLMRGGGGVEKGQKSSDVIYGQPLRYLLM